VRILPEHDTGPDSIQPFLYVVGRRGLLYIWTYYLSSVIVIITNHIYTSSSAGCRGLALIKWGSRVSVASGAISERGWTEAFEHWDDGQMMG
jgi:hypothetical protein